MEAAKEKIYDVAPREELLNSIFERISKLNEKQFEWFITQMLHLGFDPHA